VPLDCCGQPAHHFRRFLNRQPTENPQFDDAALLRIQTRQIIQRIIQGDQVYRATLHHCVRVIQRQVLAAGSTFGCASRALVPDKNLPHQQRTDRDEVSLVLKPSIVVLLKQR
jgi:hypothetical protein